MHVHTAFMSLFVSLIFLRPASPQDENEDQVFTLDNLLSEVVDTDSRFLAVCQFGERRTNRNARVTAFEKVDNGKRYRKLHSAVLGNIFPAGRYMSTDGRFFVTLDDLRSNGLSKLTIAVYDLVRNERTYFGLDDFLPKETRQSLRNHKLFPGPRWCGIASGFNSKSTKFYPTVPADCGKHRVPFVVVDLVSRTVRTLPLPDVDCIDVVELERVDGHLARDGWIRSKELVSADWVFPKYYQRFLGKSPNMGTPLYYEYHVQSGDYVQILHEDKLPTPDMFVN